MVTRRHIQRARFIGVFTAGLLVASLAVGASLAAAAQPAWLIRSFAGPANLPPGGTGRIVVDLSNVGAASANATTSPIRLVDKLPPGLTATSIAPTGEYGSFSCNLASVSCEMNSGELLPFESPRIIIEVSVGKEVPSPSQGLNVASVTGGGALPRSNSDSVDFNTTPAKFGVEQLEQVALNENGSPDTQAGSHPFEYTTTMQLNEGPGLEQVNLASPLAKDLRFNLPAGLIGNPTVLPQCTFEQFSTRLGAGANPLDLCPNNTAVGVASIYLFPRYGPVTVPLFNLVPNVGEPARFAFIIFGVPVFLDTSVKTGGDYGVVVDVNNISTIDPFIASQVTFWGAPGAPIHDNSRGWSCLKDGYWLQEEEEGVNLSGPCPVSSEAASKVPPFLTLPTSCTGPLRSSVEADSWKQPGVFTTTEYTWHDATGPLQLDGCDRLPFEPSVSVTPDGQNASTPTGLAVTEHIPQEDTLNPVGLAESDVKDTTVALPTGVQISPAGGDGLSACSMEQIGFEGPTAQGGLEFSHEEQTCPESAKVGTVSIKTPLLPNPLKGAAYLAQQDSNPFGSLVAMYIVAKDPVSGVLVKVAGEVVPNAVTGQLVTTFKNTPQLPYEDLELHFFGSARAPLTTPPLCGAYTTQASIEGWSENPPSEPSSTFDITAGPGGAPCSDPQPFTPGFQAGSLNLQAGAFTPFELTMSRPDADQTLSRVELQMPPGLLGTLSTVKLCGEPQAAEGKCGEESLIGRTTVSAGLGDSPYTVVGGKVYITGPYKGAPYGLSIVNPAKAGPFDLGDVVVRAQIRVDPHDAHLTIVSDPLPTILDGIPLQIQNVQVAVERPGGFTFNATDCEPMKITGTLTSTEGVSASESTRYQVTNCLALAFKPSLTASTTGKTSRANGASLTVKLGYPAGPYDANIAKVKVELPKQLPSQLKTLQKACTAATFEANPANCPPVSIIGHATATTPVLPVPLTGPAYFVSHGGEAFPSLIIVLQGYGATVDLVGSTFISKAGITSSTFKAIPDVPVGTFELTLPQGPYAALTANANLCKSKLVMPTEFVGQNGVVLKQATKMAVTGCPKAKKTQKKKHKKKAKKHKKKTKATHKKKH
jgi:hypothetical protein